MINLWSSDQLILSRLWGFGFKLRIEHLILSVCGSVNGLTAPTSGLMVIVISSNQLDDEFDELSFEQLISIVSKLS